MVTDFIVYYVLFLVSEQSFFSSPDCKVSLFLQVESIVLGEDCALLEQGSSVGRRGMCGMVFVFKVNLVTIARNKCGVLYNCKLILTVTLRETLRMYGGHSHVGTGFFLGTSVYPSQISVH